MGDFFTEYTNPRIMDPANDPNGVALGFRVVSQNADGSITIEIIGGKDMSYLPTPTGIHIGLGQNNVPRITWDVSPFSPVPQSLMYEIHRKDEASGLEFMWAVPYNQFLSGGHGTEDAGFAASTDIPAGFSVVDYWIVTRNGAGASKSSDVVRAGVIKGSLAAPMTTVLPLVFLVPNGATPATIPSGMAFIVQGTPTTIAFSPPTGIAQIAGTLGIGCGDGLSDESRIIGGTLAVNAGGTLQMMPGSAIRYSCNVTVGTGGHWRADGGSVSGLDFDRQYMILGDLTVQGSGSPLARAAFVAKSILTPPSGVNSSDFPNLWFGTNAAANINAAAFTGVGIYGVAAGSSTISGTLFTGLDDAAYDCIDWFEPNGPLVVQNSTFTGVGGIGRSGEAISINDNAGVAVTLSANTISGFTRGIVFNQHGGSTAFENHITNCGLGITEWMNVAGVTNISRNEIAGCPNGGVYLWTAGPHLYRNIISTSTPGVFLWQASPSMTCNDIYSSNTGIQLRALSQPDLSNGFGQNLIHANDQAQISTEVQGGAPLLQLGHNEISDDRPGSANLQDLLTGVPSSPVVAVNNYWGNAQVLPSTPVLRSTYAFAWQLPDPNPPTCTKGALMNCGDYPPADENIRYSNSCQYWIDRYNHDIACGGDCHDAVDALKAAIAACQGSDPDGALIALLQRVLSTMVGCDGRNTGELLTLATYYDSVASEALTPGVRRAAARLKAEALGVAQYFDAAKLIYDSLAATSTDSLGFVVDSSYSALMLRLKEVEGGNSGMPKQSATQYIGRAGWVTPSRSNPIALGVSPNPFSAMTRISYHLQAAGHVVVKVFDTQARDVAVLADGDEGAGTHERSFDANALPAGVYYVAVHTSDELDSRRIVLIK